MTREEKSKAIKTYCDNIESDCCKCPLAAVLKDGENCSHATAKFPCNVDRNYELLVQAGKIKPVQEKPDVEFVKVEREDKIISTALYGYGTEVQTWKFVEEIGEFLTAFARRRIADIAPVHKRGGETDNLAEEMADAQIMAEQMTMLYGIGNSIKAMRLKKLRRLAKRLGMEEVEHDEE